MLKNKRKKILISLLISFVSLCLLGLLEKFLISNPLNIDKFIWYIFISIFVFINVYFDRKKVWNFIYKKRYIIGIILFILCVARGYHFSSVGIYDEVIEPSYQIESADPLIGKLRSIRSDEFLVSTPTILSQYFNNFNPKSNKIAATEAAVTMYPQLPTRTIFLTTNPQYLGFMFLNPNHGYSFASFLPYFILFFGLFELFMILTNKNKFLSIVGTIMIEFSPVLLWWTSYNIMGYGSLACVFLYKLLNSKNLKNKIINSVLLGWSGACYIMALYPAWQIPFGYLFLGIFIYILIKNWEKTKLKNLLYLIISIVTIIVLIVPNFVYSMDVVQAILKTEYPGGRISLGGNGWELLYLYFANIFYSLSDVGNPCEYSQFLSFYPIPIILGLIISLYNFKDKKKDYLLLILTLIGLLLSIWNYIPIGNFAKYTFLSMSTPARAQIVVGIICIFIIINIFNNYNSNKTNYKKVVMSTIISIIFSLISIRIVDGYLIEYMSDTKVYISFVIITILLFMILINTKKSIKIFGYSMIITGILFFLTIQPISAGIEVMFEKPIAKEVQKINKKDKNSKWLAVNSSLFVQNYLLANGARVINSTNYYPNMKLWQKIEPTKENNFVYNRYAHIAINIINEKTNFYLNQDDMFTLNLSKKDICKMEADYIVSSSNLNDFEIKEIKQIYNKENLFIYKTYCK